MAYQLAYSELAGLWIEAGGPGSDAAIAAAVATAESGGCQFALAGPVDIRPVKVCHYTQTTKENSCGFWQINLMAHAQYNAPSIFDQITNAKAAVAISSGGTDWTPWTTYRDGSYLRFLQSDFVPTLPGPTGGTTTGTLSESEGGATAPHAHSGWADLRNSMNRHLPTQLHRAQVLRMAAMRQLAKRAKVR